jgi:hypothetical protein
MGSITATRQRKLTIVTLVSVSAVILSMLYVYWDIQSDDSYIFYSYAKNISSGHGYVFNIGQRINGTTSPLYTLLLSSGYLLLRFIPFITIPLVGHLIGGISLFFLCYFLMQSFRSEKSSLFPFILPLVFLTIPLLPAATGMETFLSLLIAMICINFYAQGRLLAASLACSFAVLARPDMILLVAVLTTYHAIRYRRLPTIKMTAVFLLPLLAWLIFSLVYFGDPIPTSLSAKLAQTEAGLWGKGLVFFNELWSFFLSFGMAVPRAILVAAVILGLIVFVIKLRRWRIFQHPAFHLILLWNLVYLLVYGIIFNAPGYGWYYTPLALGISLIATLPLEGFYRLLAKSPTVRDRILLPIIFLSLVLVGLSVTLIAPVAPVREKYETYKQAAEWLNANTQSGTSVGASDIGVLRFYYENGPVIDAAGLVNPEVIRHLRTKDFSWYIQHFQPDYLMFGHPPRPKAETMAYDEWFRRKYYVEKIIISPTMRVAIYKKIV